MTCADLDFAIFYLKQALWLARESTSTSYLYSVYDQYSRVFMKSGNFSLALEYYYKMLKLLDDEAMGAHDESALLYQKYASLYTHIGNCYFSMDNFKSLDFYRKSLEMVKKLSEIDPDYPAREREMINYINIGSAYLNNYNFMEAEINFIKALELSETLDNPVNEGTLYNNLGIVYKEKKDFDKAFEYYQRSLSIRLEYKDSIGLAQTYNNLGDAYILTGQNKTAIGVLEKAVQMSRQTGNLRSGMKAANFLSIAYENVGEIARAYDMFKVYSTLHDSIINQEAVQNSLRLEMQYQYDKQIRENELQQELLLAKKERKSLIYMIISGILLFSVTILVLLSRNQRMRIKQALLRKDRLELERKTLHLEKENLLIEKQKLEMELDFRNKELSTHVIYLLKKK